MTIKDGRFKCCGSAEDDNGCEYDRTDDYEDVVVNENDTDGGISVLQHRLFLKAGSWCKRVLSPLQEQQRPSVYFEVICGFLTCPKSVLYPSYNATT